MKMKLLKKGLGPLPEKVIRGYRVTGSGKSGVCIQYMDTNINYQPLRLQAWLGWSENLERLPVFLVFWQQSPGKTFLLVRTLSGTVADSPKLKPRELHH